MKLLSTGAYHYTCDKCWCSHAQWQLLNDTCHRLELLRGRVLACESGNEDKASIRVHLLFHTLTRIFSHKLGPSLRSQAAIFRRDYTESISPFKRQTSNSHVTLISCSLQSKYSIEKQKQTQTVFVHSSHCDIQWTQENLTLEMANYLVLHI